MKPPVRNEPVALTMSTLTLARGASVALVRVSDEGLTWVQRDGADEMEDELSRWLEAAATPGDALAIEAELPFDGEAAYEEVAHLCTAFGYVADRAQLQEFLQEAARVVTATGLIVWFWDEESDVLRPALAHGYSARVLTHLPVLPRDADNATAAAFRATASLAAARSAAPRSSACSRSARNARSVSTLPAVWLRTCVRGTNGSFLDAVEWR